MDLGLEDFECLADEGVVFEFLHGIARAFGFGSRGAGEAFLEGHFDADGAAEEGLDEVLEEGAIVGLFAVFEGEAFVRREADEGGVGVEFQEGADAHPRGDERTLLLNLSEECFPECRGVGGVCEGGGCRLWLRCDFFG